MLTGTGEIYCWTSRALVVIPEQVLHEARAAGRQ